MHFIHAQDVPYLARLHSGVTLSDLSERGVQAKYAYNFDPVKQPFLSSFIYINTSKTSFLDDLKASGVLLYWEHPRTQQFYFEPSDPSFSLQWHLDKIMVPTVWETAQGDSSFVVANDTGPAHMAAHLGSKGLALFGSHTTAYKVSIERENFKAIQVTDLNKLSPEKVFEYFIKSLN